MQNNESIHKFKTHRNSGIQVVEISSVVSKLSTEEIERHHSGHSLERTHQLACADALASHMLGQPTRIQRDPSGAPHLPEVIERVSISHTANFMAMLLSDAPILALDIEIMERDIERIIPRFTQPSEIELYSSLGIVNPALVVWSVKECLFKAVPVDKVLFKEHFLIDRVESKEVIISHCSIEHPELRAHVSVVSRIFDPLIVSYIDQSAYGHEAI